MTNKIPQEIEDAVINHFRYQWDKDGNDDNSPDMSEEDIISELYLWFEGFLVKEIKEVFKAGQKQAREDVLKLIDDLQIKYPNFALILDKLKAGVKNGKED
jgi:hypothetical protein